MITGIGGPNGPGTKEPYARWFRYPAGFSPDALTLALERIGNPGSLLVDPFAGVATAGAELGRRGIEFAGIEAHREIAELADLKFRPTSAVSDLRAIGRVVVETACESSAKETALVESAFPGPVLAELVRIRDAVKGLDDPWAPYLKWALLGSLRDLATIGVGWPYQRPARVRRARSADVRQSFLRRVDRMAEDLGRRPQGTLGKVVSGDSRHESAWQLALGSRLATASLSSPPYLNNFDYADASRLEMYFWGAASSWSDLTSNIRAPLLPSTTQQTTQRSSYEAALGLAQRRPRLWRSLEPLHKLLVDERALRKRGKEYDQLVVSYFNAISMVLETSTRYLSAGALVIWVVGDSAPYGIHVDTPELLALAAQEVGFERMDVLAIRQRGSRWHSNGTRHSIPLSESLLVLRAPGQG